MFHAARRVPALFVVLGLALLARLAWVMITPAVPIQDYKEYYSLAVNMAEGRGFVNAIGPTAFRPPGYPFALAAVFVVFGKSLLVVRLFNTLLGVLSVYLTYYCARRVFGHTTALVSALLVALMPNLIFFTGQVATENLAVLLLLLGTACFIKAFQEDRPLFFWLTGLVFGLAALTRPTNLYLALLLPFFLLVRKVGFGKLMRSGALLWTGLALALLPWGLRNDLVSGHFNLSGTNGGFNLLMSFSDDATGTYTPVPLSRAFQGEYDWTTNRFTGEDLDEYQIDAKATRLAVGYILQHPLRSAALAPLKLYHLLRDSVSGAYDNLFDDQGQFLLPPSLRLVYRLLQVIAQGYYLLVLLLMLVGLLRKGLFSRIPAAARSTDAVLFLAYLGFMLALHSVFIGMDRYHLPYLPFFSMFSAVGLLGLLRRFAERRRPAQPALSSR